jgi:hypothetical protein
MKGNLTRRGRRSWRFRFEAGTDPITKQRITKAHTLRGTRKEAEEQAAKIVAAYSTGQYVDQDKQTVKEFAGHWLMSWAAGNVSNKTFERYEALIKVQSFRASARSRSSGCARPTCKRSMPA